MLIGAESCVFIISNIFLCAPKAYKKCDVLFMSRGKNSLFLDCHLENA